MSYDKKCFELAQSFLEDYVAADSEETQIKIAELAQSIQETIDDFLTHEINQVRIAP